MLKLQRLVEFPPSSNFLISQFGFKATRSLLEKLNMQKCAIVWVLFLMLLQCGYVASKSCKVKCLEESLRCVEAGTELIDSVNCLIKKYKCKEACCKSAVKTLREELRNADL